jgi:hypothetical protein|tara:strand:+ start:439 stop:618 length:180 start_codon:yes stop_codon:yes gene_type:complete
MKCWHCDTELIWGGDHDIQEIDDTYNEHYSEDTEYMMETNLSCPECQSLTIVYLPKEKT